MAAKKKQAFSALLAIAALLANAAIGLAKAGEDNPAIVRAPAGTVRGEATNEYRRFLGIPYARPPLGELRWRAPQPLPRWDGVRDATTRPPSCPQTPVPGTKTAAGALEGRLDEDCLYLNITLPAHRTHPGDLPVMVWLHGGGLYNGSGADYDARRLAELGDVMVVTVNYRLGMLGFFGYPGLSGSGTFGLQDQQTALRWVRRNAAAFGGDKNNVTLFGESAGAMSTCAHLVAPSSRGLFDKVILQSGTCQQSWAKGMIWPTAGPFFQFAPLAEIEQLGVATAASLDCSGPQVLACLRAVPSKKLLGNVWPVSHVAYGSSFLAADPAILLREGKLAAVPIMWGSTRDEWRVGAATLERDKHFTNDTLAKLVKEAFGALSTDVLNRYPSDAAGGPGYDWSAISTDSAWSCETLESARQASSRAQVFLFEFADRQAPNPAFDVPNGFELRAAHATDLAYVFDLGGVKANFTPAQEELSRTMIGYWSTFARTGDPNHAGAPSWPRFSSADPSSALALAPAPDGPAAVDIGARHNCDLLSRIGPTPR